MAHRTDLLALVAMGFGLAILLGLVATRFRLPPLVGYLVAGVAVGPFTPGFVADAELAAQLAEIGVILLMFGVGIHFSIRDLLAVRSISVPGAIAQIAVATAMGTGLATLFGWGLGEGLVFGVSLSVASTVVLLRALEERRAVDSLDGRIAVGWLIVEDLAMVVALVLLPALADLLGGTAGEPAQGSIIGALALTLGKVALFLALMLVGGRRAIPWFLARVARTGSRELSTLAVLALALGIAVGAAVLFDVSFALGAFFAGVVIAESDLSYQAAADALPFQDAFAVLFFVSVGMLFDPAVVLAAPIMLLGVVLIIIIGKSLAAFAIVLAFRYPVRTALTVSASLAQIGEFSFILAGLGVTLGLLSSEGQSLILAGAIISITLNPLMFRLIDPIERWFRVHPDVKDRLERGSGDLAMLPPEIDPELQDHVVLIGYGRVGRPVAEALQRQQIPYLVVEQNRQTVESLRRQGFPVIYGDATRPGILEHARLEHARLLVIASPDALQARLILQQARQLRPEIDTVVRTHSDVERTELEKEGVGRAVVGERELALAIIRYTFGSYDVRQDMGQVAAEMLQLPDPHSGRKTLLRRRRSTD